jgi:hypothetical protein
MSWKKLLESVSESVNDHLQSGVAMESDELPLTRSYSTIDTSLYPKEGVKWCSCALFVPVRSGWANATSAPARWATGLL